MYENPWLFNGEIFELVDKKYEGFVYLITNNINGKKYIGKKHFWSRVKPKGGTRRVTKESDWKKYYGSCDPLKDDIEEYGSENFSRIILHLCYYKKEMSFWEEKEQWDNNVLLEDDYYNTNIAGRYFVREKHIYEGTTKEISEKNDNWRKIKSESMMGELNHAKKPEVRKKISDKKSGENHHQFGKPISESHKEKLHSAAHAARRKKVIDENGIIYESASEYRKINNVYIHKFYKLIKDNIISYIND